MNPLNTIGIIELASIYKGYEVQDLVLKHARVEKLLARTICSGKYLIIVRGELADVEDCLEMAKKTGSFSIINTLYVPNVDDKIFSAISGCITLDCEKVDAMILLETFSVAAVIKAADLAVKEADIDVPRIHVAMAIGGKGFAVLTGNADSLKSAIVPAVEFLSDDGSLAGYTLITNPHPDVLRDLI
ncbi:MAG: BMC domain-containing protein [Phycisphaerae bacterium]|nr:BMC domain-containing protein [Phycisphaerae bacterium]